MRKLQLILLLSFLQLGCYAQKKLKEGAQTLNGKSFSIKNLNVKGYKNQPVVFISTSKNKYPNTLPKPKKADALRILEKDINVDHNKIRLIINETLDRKTAILKENDETISLMFFFEQSGKISDINYTVKESTNITLLEIDQIDSRLRDEIRAKFTGNDYLNFYIITVYSFIKF